MMNLEVLWYDGWFANKEIMILAEYNCRSLSCSYVLPCGGTQQQKEKLIRDKEM